MIKFTVLGSGSQGNAVYVEVDGIEIMLDVGLSFKQLCARLSDINRSITDVTHIFISHQHGDHVKAVGMIERKVRPTPFIYQEKVGNLKENDNVYLLGSGNNVPCVTAFRLDHDDPCLGFSVVDGAGNKLLYVTDTGTIPCDSLVHMMEYDALIIEANHDVEMLNQCSYPVDRQERVFQTHLENYQAREFVEVTKSERLKYIVLHHLSGNNNNPALAEYEIKAGLGADYNHVKVVVGEQKFATQLMVLI